MWRDRAALAVVAVFGAAVVYGAALALEWIRVGRDPGDDPARQAAVTAGALVAVAATLVLSTLRPRGPPYAFVPVAAAAWMVAHYYAFDPYHLPSHRRYADGGVGVAILDLQRGLRGHLPVGRQSAVEIGRAGPDAAPCPDLPRHGDRPRAGPLAASIIEPWRRTAS
jgi:hypothetical protein